MSIRLRATIISAVFKKSLTMTHLSKKKSTTGEIVNLMSVDVQHLQEVISYLWALWSSPLQICVALYFLYNTLGPSMFAGLAVMVLMFPVNTIVMVKVQKYTTDLMEQKDKRIKLLTEVLNGIKILKLYAWELSFRDKVLLIRDMELKILWKSSILMAVMIFSWMVAPYLVSLATFATYIFVSENHYLDAQTAFVAISLFNILSLCYQTGSHDNWGCSQGWVLHNQAEDLAVTITDGTFLWDYDIGPILRKDGRSHRKKNLTGGGEELYEATVETSTAKLIKLRKRVENTIEEFNSAKHQRDLVIKLKDRLGVVYDKFLDEVKGFMKYLTCINTSASNSEKVSQEMIHIKIYRKVTDVHNEMVEILKQPETDIEENKEQKQEVKKNSQTKSHSSVSSSTTSSRRSSLLARQRAKSEAAKTSLTFTRQEVEMQK
ncbi:hypothetical protein ScPMuIL_013405 [Solemya velum]